MVLSTKNDYVEAFINWAEKNLKVGVNGNNEKCTNVPPSRLRRDWGVDKVRQILDACNLSESAEQITKRFLRIFYTLMYIGQPEDITLFTRPDQDDLALPLLALPRQRQQALEKFWDAQWMFCPQEFSEERLFKRELHSRHILPITYGDSLRKNAWGGDGPSIEMVEIDAECNEMTPKDTPVVFKIFRGNDHNMQELFKAEADVYSALSEQPAAQKNIATHYGSFSFEDTHTRIIILEHAPLGSLLDFFATTDIPVTPKHFDTLWCALLKLLMGLYALHNLRRLPVSRESMNGWTIAVHQDIQPANILVFPGPEYSPENKESRFNVQFKLADFGLAEVRRVLNPDEHFKIVNEGNCMYSAPECYVNYEVQYALRPTVTTSVDVWALGAVYSDALVWSLSGESGREDYRKARVKAIDQLKRFKAAGFEACFHNTEDKLDAVTKFHAKVLEHARKSDLISPRMSELILNDMLRVAASRASATILRSRADEMIEEIRHKAAVGDSKSSHSPPTSDPDRMSPMDEDTLANRRDVRQAPPDPRPPTPQKKLPAITDKGPDNDGTQEERSEPAPVERVYEYLLKKGRWSRRLQGKPHEVSAELPGLEDARSKISVTGGRDQIFLIDNYASMEEHLEKVAKTARVISYYAKTTDDDGMDLFFASKSTTPIKCSSSTKLELAIKRNTTWIKGKSNMGNCLRNVTDAARKSKKKGIRATSIYIFTDGVWEKDDMVERIIRQSITNLIKVDEPPSTLMFQFIQFGNDDEGTERLEKLDDHCKVQHELGEYDIVDTKRWDSEVVADMVVGSISPEIDNRKSTSQKPQPDRNG